MWHFLHSILLGTIERPDPKSTGKTIAFEAVPNISYHALLNRLDDGHRYVISGRGLTENHRGNVMEMTLAVVAVMTTKLGLGASAVKLGSLAVALGFHSRQRSRRCTVPA